MTVMGRAHHAWLSLMLLQKESADPPGTQLTCLAYLARGWVKMHQPLAMRGAVTGQTAMAAAPKLLASFALQQAF